MLLSMSMKKASLDKCVQTSKGAITGAGNACARIGTQQVDRCHRGTFSGSTWRPTRCHAQPPCNIDDESHPAPLGALISSDCMRRGIRGSQARVSVFPGVSHAECYW